MSKTSCPKVPVARVPLLTGFFWCVALFAAGCGSSTNSAPGDSDDTLTTLPSTSSATIIVEPSDSASGLLHAIQNAQSSVHMTMYMLSNSSIINALTAQKSSGHDVKVILNSSFPSGGNSNQSAYNTLNSAGVAMHWASSSFTYTHEKCVIIDGTTAWIMTMNATYSSPTDNREYLAVDTDPEDVAEAEAIFQADFNNTPAPTNGKLLVAPVNARDRLVALIAAASDTIDIEAETLSDSVIVNALNVASDHGVTVKIVLSDGTPSSSQSDSVNLLKQHGVHLVKVSSPYIHAKSLVVDGKLAYVGSENFTTGSLQYNRELGGIFSAAAEVQKVLTTTTGDFARGTSL